MWEDCTQEEARLEARKEKIENNEDQALTTHARKGKNKKEVHCHKRFQKPHKGQDSHKDLSSFRCFICQKWDILQEIVPKQKTKIKPGSLKGIMPISQEKMNLIGKEQKKMIQMNYIFYDIGLSVSKALDSCSEFVRRSTVLMTSCRQQDVINIVDLPTNSEHISHHRNLNEHLIHIK